jgi:hypothetical protein
MIRESGSLKPNKARLSTGSSHASCGKAYGFRLLVYASGEGGLIETNAQEAGCSRWNACPASPDPPTGSLSSGARRRWLAETREAIRQSQQTIDETRELMPRLDLVIA